MEGPPTSAPAGRRRAALPLLTWVIVALLLVGLLPIGISALQIYLSRDALLDQAQAVHLTAARSIAAEVEARIEALAVVGRSVARHPVLAGDPGSDAARDLLAGLPQAQDEILAAALYRVDPFPAELLWLARQREYRQIVEQHLRPDDPRPLVLERQGDGFWLRVRTPLDDVRLALFLLADMGDLDVVMAGTELGDEAELVLASRDGDLLAGEAGSLETFAEGLIANARGGQVRSGTAEFAGAGGERSVGAWAAVADSPWFVLSQQPARKAEAAAERIWQTSRVAFGATLLLTVALSFAAHRSIIAPLRRLVAAQRSLAGLESVSASGDEIAQLQESFALIERNLHDREALNRVFLGRYQVVEVLGAGAMGTVFRGWDPRLQRPVALKTVKVQPESYPGAESADRKEAAERLVREAVTLARLQHPNIVTVFDVVHQGGYAFIAMELIEGQSLEHLLWRRHHLGPNQVVPLAIAVLKALDAAHREGFVHHDVKPGNVLLGNDGAIKVTDFGVSELLTQAHKERDMVCGTPGYLAPETLLRRGYTAESDLFAAGVLLYECLTGQRPFQGDSVREVLIATTVATPPPIKEQATEYSEELEELILRLLEKVPEERPDARTVLQALERMATDNGWKWDPGVLKPGSSLGEIDANERAHTVLLRTLDRQPRGGTF